MTNIFIGFNVVPSGYFMSIEKANYASVISTSRGIAALLIFLLLFTAIWKGAGIWWSPLASELATLAITVWLLKKHKKAIKMRFIAQNEMHSACWH